MASNGFGADVTRSLWQKLRYDPYYRMQSVSEVRLASELGIRIDANTACVDDWLRLPGLSIHQARSIAALTQAGVQFHCLEDLAAALDLPIQRLQPWAPVLQFCYYDEASLERVQTVDANTASVEMLIRIPAVDLFLARAIVQNRQQGVYKNLSDLQQRLVLPASLTTDLLHYLRFR